MDAVEFLKLYPPQCIYVVTATFSEVMPNGSVYRSMDDCGVAFLWDDVQQVKNTLRYNAREWKENPVSKLVEKIEVIKYERK